MDIAFKKPRHRAGFFLVITQLQDSSLLQVSLAPKRRTPERRAPIQETGDLSPQAADYFISLGYGYIKENDIFTQQLYYAERSVKCPRFCSTQVHPAYQSGKAGIHFVMNHPHM